MVIRTHRRKQNRHGHHKDLQRLLEYVWKHSAFYRDYYQSHGIREEDLEDLTVGDLPLLSRRTLMENFDKAVTDSRLNRADVEHWLHDNPDPHLRFAGDFFVVHSSGSSGNIAIFVYDEKSWRIADFAMASRMFAPHKYPSGPIKAAFYMATHGHFAMVSIAASMQKPLYETRLLSLLDSREGVVQQLNTFKPHRLYGYSSSITDLANLALEGRLDIQPDSILVAGDKLTPAMERTIRRAWPARIHVTYGASESKYIAIKEAGDEEMQVLTDLNIIEVLDDRRERVGSGSEGRVVLTNLHNYTLPIIRYEFDDYVVVGKEDHGTVTTIRDIKGRVNDALPVVLRGGKHDTIHPIILSEFHVPRLEKIQFISKGADHVCIQYVAPVDLDAAVAGQFQRILNSKDGAQTTTFEVRRVHEIQNDPATGKLRLVRFDAAPKMTAPKMTQTARASYNVRCLEHPKGHCVHRIFEQEAHARPDSLALSCDRDSLTYSQLNARANQLAHYLRLLGVGPNTLVGICVARSNKMAVGILGILKAGGAWVPMDEAYPAERQSLVFRDAGISVLISEEAIACKLPPHSITTLLLDRDWDSISKCSTSDPEPVTSSGSLAYVMYTSGSTGQPKGVMITHGNLCHYVRAMQRRLDISERDVYLHTASIAFSSSVRQLMVPLTCGAKVVIARQEDIRQPLALFRKIRDEGVTVTDVVPSYWRTCIDALSDLDISARRNLLKNDLRLILTASEILPPDLPARWRSEVGHPAQLINMFGQTETTGIVATYTIPDTNDGESKTVPIGYPIDDTHIYVLDDHLHEVPTDTIGELYVAGPTIGAGYLNQPDISGERFLADPFKRTTFERLYRTGDLGRCRPDGSLEFVGRVDHQIKIRGIRVELQEIEAALQSHPSVKEAVVIVRQDEPKHQRVVAYVVPAAGSALAIETLRSSLAKKLPEFMIPAAFVTMDSLPRLPNGKLDRLRLPAPSQTRPQFEHSMVAPRNVTELKLARIWQAVLVIAGIGVLDNFFDLGGNSLSALYLLAQVDKVFGKKLPPTAIFQASTIEQMAQLLHEDGVVPSNVLCAIQTHGSKPPFFWIHGEVSNAFLPRYLGPDQPIYALTHQSEDGAPARFTTVESMAGGYLEEIRAVQPTGPYFLGGFCFGGLIAFEIAQQLKAAGEEVSLLVWFEPTPLRACGSSPLLPLSSPAATVSKAGLREEGLRHLSTLRQLRGRDRMTYVWLRLRSRVTQSLLKSRPANHVRQLLCVIYHRLGRPLPFSLRSFYILRVYGRATRQYTVRKYPGSVDLFLHPATPEEGSPHTWSQIAVGNVEIHEVPEGHEEILKEPKVRIWADILKACLHRAQAAQQDGASSKVSTAV